MFDLGVTACVSDESIITDSGESEDQEDKDDYIPTTPYHGWYTTQAFNNFVGVYIIPRETLDIDYCDTTPAMVVDEFNFHQKAGSASFNFEQIFAIQTKEMVADKLAFRHDPFMLHQANAMIFPYSDPFHGGTVRNVSMISLFMERSALEMASYYTYPVIHHQMDTLVHIFKQRQSMDGCGINATLGIDANNNIVEVTVVGSSTCQMSLSGVALPSTSTGTATMETYATETTAWINLVAGVAQYFFPATPIPM